MRLLLVLVVQMTLNTLHYWNIYNKNNGTVDDIVVGSCCTDDLYTVHHWNIWNKNSGTVDETVGYCCTDDIRTLHFVVQMAYTLSISGTSRIKTMKL